ncbi:hypothetical protein, partial [Salmonella sp. s58953]
VSGALPLNAVLESVEITGAQTFLHLRHGPDKWVGLIDGVQRRELGQELTVWLDPAHIYLFTPGGELARAAPYAAAA